VDDFQTNEEYFHLKLLSVGFRHEQQGYILIVSFVSSLRLHVIHGLAYNANPTKLINSSNYQQSSSTFVTRGSQNMKAAEIQRLLFSCLLQTTHFQLLSGSSTKRFFLTSARLTQNPC